MATCEGFTVHSMISKQTLWLWYRKKSSWTKTRVALLRTETRTRVSLHTSHCTYRWATETCRLNCTSNYYLYSSLYIVRSTGCGWCYAMFVTWTNQMDAPTFQKWWTSWPKKVDLWYQTTFRLLEGGRDETRVHCTYSAIQFRLRPQPDRPHCRHFIYARTVLWCIGGHCLAPNLGHTQGSER